MLFSFVLKFQTMKIIQKKTWAIPFLFIQIFFFKYFSLYFRHCWIVMLYNCHIHYLITLLLILNSDLRSVLRFQNIQTMFRALWNSRSKHKQMTLRPSLWFNKAMVYVGYISRSGPSNVVWLNKAMALSNNEYFLFLVPDLFLCIIKS